MTMEKPSISAPLVGERRRRARWAPGGSAWSGWLWC